VTTVQKKLQLMVTEAAAETSSATGTDAGAANDVKAGQVTGGAGIGKIVVIIAAAVVVILAVLLFLKKKKKKKKEDAALDADLHSLDENTQPLSKDSTDDRTDQN